MTSIFNLMDRCRISRQRTADNLPLPDFIGCVEYAITEGGESIDAGIYERRPHDKRNNARNRDRRAEFGQMGYMIASALIQDMPPMFVQQIHHYKPSVYSVLIPLCKYMDYLDTARSYPALIVTAMHIWTDACAGYGWDAAELMDETCQAFEEKWATVMP